VGAKRPPFENREKWAALLSEGEGSATSLKRALCPCEALPADATPTPPAYPEIFLLT
jgi:hypothetical protein